MEMRLGKINTGKAGGTAAIGSKTYKLTLPSSWVTDMGLADGSGRVVLSFDGGKITICPIRSMEEYKAERLSQGHTLQDIRYYNGSDLCTVIYADMTARDLRVENHTDLFVKTAFGKNPLPTWEDLESFLEERCIPRQRAGLREYLETLGLEEYDPYAIIRMTRGRMAEDDQWLEVNDIR